MTSLALLVFSRPPNRLGLDSHSGFPAASKYTPARLHAAALRPLRPRAAAALSRDFPFRLESLHPFTRNFIFGFIEPIVEAFNRWIEGLQLYGVHRKNLFQEFQVGLDGILLSRFPPDAPKLGQFVLGMTPDQVIANSRP